MTNQSFDNQVKQKIGDHESPVPAGVWEAIEQKKKKRRYPFFWWLLLGAIMAGAGIGFNGLVKKTPVQEKAKVESKKVEPNLVRINTSAEVSTPEVSAGTNAPKQNNNVTSLAGEKNKIDQAKISNASADEIISITKQTVQQTQEPKEGKAVEQIYGKRHRKASSSEDAKKPSTSTAIENGDDITLPIKNQLINGSDEYSFPAVKTSGGVNPTASESKARYSAAINFTRAQLPGISNDQLLSSVLKNRDSLPYRNDILRIASKTDSVATAAVTVATKKVASKKSRWWVEVAVNPFMPLRQKMALASVDRSTTGTLHLSEYKGDELSIQLQPSVSYTIMLRKKISRRLLLGAGLQYGVIKEHVKLSGTETNTNFQVVQRLENGSGGPVLINDTVATVTSGKRTIDAINSYRFFDLPLSLQYVLVERRGFSLSAMAGLNIGLYSHYNNSIEGDIQPKYSSGSAVVKRSAARVEFSTGLRLSQRVFKRTVFFAEPYLRFNAGTYRGSIFNNQRVHQAGMGIGVVFEMGGR